MLPRSALLKPQEQFIGPQAKKFFSRVSHVSDINIPADEDPEEFFKRLNEELAREDYRFLNNVGLA